MKRLLIITVIPLLMVSSQVQAGWGMRNVVWVDHDNDPKTPMVESKMSNKAYKEHLKAETRREIAKEIAIDEDKIRQFKENNKPNCLPPTIESGPVGSSAAGIIIAMAYSRCIDILANPAANVADAIRASNGNSESAVAQYGRSNNALDQSEISQKEETKRTYIGAGIQLAGLWLAYRGQGSSGGSNNRSIGDNNSFVVSPSMSNDPSFTNDLSTGEGAITSNPVMEVGANTMTFSFLGDVINDVPNLRDFSITDEALFGFGRDVNLNGTSGTFNNNPGGTQKGVDTQDEKNGADNGVFDDRDGIQIPLL